MLTYSAETKTVLGTQKTQLQTITLLVINNYFSLFNKLAEGYMTFPLHSSLQSHDRLGEAGIIISMGKLGIREVKKLFSGYTAAE